MSVPASVNLFAALDTKTKKKKSKVREGMYVGTDPEMRDLLGML
jgi:hypothetical protein